MSRRFDDWHPPPPPQAQQTYTLTVYLAAPGTLIQRGKEVSHSQAGHMYYSISDGRETRGYGFSPIDSGTHGPGRVVLDEYRDYKNPAYSRTMQITAEQFSKFKEYGEAGLEGKETYFNLYYRGLRNSCIDFTWGALNHAGLHTMRKGQVYPNPVEKRNVSSRTVTINYYFYDAERDAASRAMATWNRAMATWNTVGPGFRYVAGGFSSYHPSGSNFNRPCDSQSGIGEDYNVPGATVAAEVRLCYLSGTSILSDADMFVNQQMLTNGSFHSGTTSAPSNKYDFDTIMPHEFGHFLRLLHDGYSNSVVMRPNVSLGQTKRTPHFRDRTGKATLYP